MSDRTWELLLATGPSTLTAFLAFLKGHQNQKAIQEVHLILNSRLDQLLKQTGIAQFAAGRAEGERTK